MTVDEEQHGILAISRGSSPEKLDSFPGVLAVREQILVDDPPRSIDERFSRRRTRHEHEEPRPRRAFYVSSTSPAASDHSLGAGELVHPWCPMVLARMTASQINRMGTSVEDACRESSRTPRRAPAPRRDRS